MKAGLEYAPGAVGRRCKGPATPRSSALPVRYLHSGEWRLFGDHEGGLLDRHDAPDLENGSIHSR